MTKSVLSSERLTVPIATTAAYYVAFIGLGLVSASLGPTLPKLRELTGVSLGEISYLITARSLGYLAGSVIGGQLYDRLRGHPLFFGFGLLAVAMLVLTPTISLLWALVVVMVLTGVGQGVVDLGGNTMLVWVHKERVDPYMNGLHFIWGVGAFLGPVLIAQLLLWTNDLRWAYWGLALLVFLCLVWTVRLPSPRPIDEEKGARVDGQAGGMIALITLFYFGIIGVEVAFASWITTYALELGMLNEINAAYLTSALFGALTLARLVGIPLAARFTPTQILFGDLGFCLVSLGLVLLFPQSVEVLWIGTIGLGAGMASLFPSMLAWAQKRTTLTGKTTSWFFIGGSLGGMVVPWGIGQLFESIGPRFLITMSFVSMALTLLLFMELSRRFRLT